MVRKSSPKSTRGTAKRAKRPTRASATPKPTAGFKIPGANLGELSKMAKVLTPEQQVKLEPPKELLWPARMYPPSLVWISE